ncbi:MAG: hypothetical protein FJ249_09110 [Nitrospira sp.]|nr:hypothetical protein [Nitrospira sp.]
MPEAVGAGFDTGPNSNCMTRVIEVSTGIFFLPEGKGFPTRPTCSGFNYAAWRLPGNHRNEGWLRIAVAGFTLESA